MPNVIFKSEHRNLPVWGLWICCKPDLNSHCLHEHLRSMYLNTWTLHLLISADWKHHFLQIMNFVWCAYFNVSGHYDFRLTKTVCLIKINSRSQLQSPDSTSAGLIRLYEVQNWQILPQSQFFKRRKTGAKQQITRALVLALVVRHFLRKDSGLFCNLCNYI